MTVAPIIKKIPGEPPRFENEKDGYVNLSAMNKLELLDLLGREKKLLNNKKFIDKLPDKGNKIKNFHSKIETELKKRDEQDKLCNLISNLSVNESKIALNKLEWTGDYNSMKDSKAETDADDFIKKDTDPLKIIASHSGTSVSSKKLLKVEKYENLSKPSVLNTSRTAELDIDLYAQHLCRLVDNKGEIREKKFYPNKSLNKTFVKNTPSNKEPEISAAYVPKNISGSTKLLSLGEAITVHQEQLKNLKEIEANNAVERLMQKFNVETKLPKNFITSYREQDTENSDDEDSSGTEENPVEEYDDEKKLSNLSDVD